MSGKKVTALVTGATAGLGEEFCRQLADRCDVIIAIGRRADRLEALADALAGQAEVHGIVADLGTVDGVAAVMEALRQKGPVDYLVNNAGFSTYGYFASLGIEAQRQMVSVHIDASITLCRAAVDFMRERGGGYIINVSSMGSFLPGKGLAVYGASKAFLTYFSQALQAEVSADGVRVQALCPGYIHTEFHDDMSRDGFDKARIPEEMWMDAESVVRASLDGLEGDEVVVIPGEVNQQLVRGAVEQQLAGLQ